MYMLLVTVINKKEMECVIFQMADEHQFYLPKDTHLKLDMFANDVGSLSSYWSSLGRPLLIFPVSSNLNSLGLNIRLFLVFLSDLKLVALHI